MTHKLSNGFKWNYMYRSFIMKKIIDFIDDKK